jgi:hypothetical protein
MIEERYNANLGMSSTSHRKNLKMNEEKNESLERIRKRMKILEGI